jgi:5-amino-6-(5-phosphoribosylamino)uracil reductase
VVAAGDPLDPTALLADLATRGVARLLVEGGTGTNTLFLTAGLVDELHLVIAPFLVGDPGAPRLVGAGRFAHDRGNRARLAGTERLGDCVLLRYALSDRCALG